MWSAVRRAELCFSAAAMVMVMRQANTSSSYGGLRLATQATKELPKASTPPPAPTPLPDAPLFKAKKLEDWLGPESFQYKGLLVSREPTWKDCQDVVDRVANRGEFGEDDDIKVKGVSAKEDLVAVADKLLVKVKLPEDVCEAIRRDVLEVGATVRSLCPWSDGLDFKLEIIGENSCTRWHRDNYCARAIVTYNSGGTEYAADANVDFWELENCGNNACIIKDPSEICAVGVGDVLFMKGQKFPKGPRGLVHKSPEILYHYNGLVVNRLVLKVRRLKDIVEELVAYTGRQSILFIAGIINTAMLITLTSHFLSCAWYFVGRNSQDEGKQSWLEIANAAEVAAFTQYMHSLRYVINAPAPPRVAPDNGGELLVDICINIMVLMVLGTAVSKISSTLIELRAMNEVSDRQRREIRLYLTRQNTPFELITRIMKFVDYRLDKTSAISFDDGLISKTLQHELYLSQRSGFLEQIPILSLCQAVFPEVFAEICAMLERHVFERKENVFTTNSWATQMDVTTSGSYTLLSTGRAPEQVQGVRWFFRGVPLHRRSYSRGRVDCQDLCRDLLSGRGRLGRRAGLCAQLDFSRVVPRPSNPVHQHRHSSAVSW
ncbi:unnamed protein product [Symbiodinium microadriaticum]|nr:unnamed protein product [Symbiodinium microadriaticum]